MRPRPQAATLALRRCVCRSFPLGKSWRTRRTARHKPKVSVLPLYCAAVILRAFFVKVLFQEQGQAAERGTLPDGY